VEEKRDGGSRSPHFDRLEKRGGNRGFLINGKRSGGNGEISPRLGPLIGLSNKGTVRQRGLTVIEERAGLVERRGKKKSRRKCF